MEGNRKILFAPWRMKYVEYVAIEPKRGCFLCEAARSKDDEKNFVLCRTDNALVMLNLFPYNTGHLLIAPYRHVGDVLLLNREECIDLINLLKVSLIVLRKTYSPDGFNIGVNIGSISGAGLEDHVHIHVVPRWKGDTNFMPIIANTKVIPEALEDTYRKLIRLFSKEKFS